MITWLQNLLSPQTSNTTHASASALLNATSATANTFFDGTKQSHAPDETKAVLRAAKLIMVTPDNNNKYYDMSENSDGTFTVIYGRVGAKGTTVTYPMKDWQSKVNEKLKKGYKDQTHLFAIGGVDSENNVDGINCNLVKGLVKELIRYAKQSISHNYVVTADKVTRQQVNEAQSTLDNLVKMLENQFDLTTFNKQLIELFAIIPRRMTDVRQHLAEANTTMADLQKMLVEEQSTLDVMRGQVEINEQQNGQVKEEKMTPLSILDAMGIEIDFLSDQKIIKLIKKMMGDNSAKFKNAYVVKHHRSQTQFDKFVSNAQNGTTTLFWHGSRNENWLSILKTGLVLRPANAVINGKMFGYGLYFADKCQKSINYTSLHGSYWTKGNDQKAFLAIYEVHTGNQLHIDKHESWCGLLNDKNLKSRGAQYDSVFAHGGYDLLNNEFIIYNEAQCTVKYLIEIQ